MSIQQRFFILVLIALSGCSNDSVQPSNCADSIPRPLEMMVLCEGLYGYDNASLWGIGNNASYEVFACRNGRRLGDTANDVVRISDSTCIIIVSTSNEIITLDKHGTIIHSLQVKGQGHFLKKSCIINDSVIAITDLYADKVYTFDHKHRILDSLQIPNLCAPDGIAFGLNQLVIANSGYGIFRKDEANASTIAVYDLNTKMSRFVKSGINPQFVSFDSKTHQWMIQYAHLTTLPDSLGGLILYDEEFDAVQHFRGQFIGMQYRIGEYRYALCGKSIVRFHDEGAKLDTIFMNQSRNQWHRIGLVKSKLYICNARNYMLPGSIIVLNEAQTQIDQEIPVGINPNMIIEFSL